MDKHKFDIGDAVCKIHNKDNGDTFAVGVVTGIEWAKETESYVYRINFDYGSYKINENELTNDIENELDQYAKYVMEQAQLKINLSRNMYNMFKSVSTL